LGLIKIILRRIVFRPQDGNCHDLFLTPKRIIKDFYERNMNERFIVIEKIKDNLTPPRLLGEGGTLVALMLPKMLYFLTSTSLLGKGKTLARKMIDCLTSTKKDHCHGRQKVQIRLRRGIEIAM
jgi:hypothetical protein